MNVLFEGKFAKDLLRQRQQSPDLLQSLQGVLIGQGRQGPRASARLTGFPVAHCRAAQ
jgi:hypothetical protein